MEEETMIAFRVPARHKRAYEMVAAHQDTTISAMLREAVEATVIDYKDGIFFDLAERPVVQERTNGNSEV